MTGRLQRRATVKDAASGMQHLTEDDDWCADYLISPKLNEPELSAVCKSFQIVEDRTYHKLYTVFGRPLFRRQKGFGSLVLKRRD